VIWTGPVSGLGGASRPGFALNGVKKHRPNGLPVSHLRHPHWRQTMSLTRSSIRRSGAPRSPCKQSVGRKSAIPSKVLQFCAFRTRRLLFFSCFLCHHSHHLQLCALFLTVAARCGRAVLIYLHFYGVLGPSFPHEHSLWRFNEARRCNLMHTFLQYPVRSQNNVMT